MRRGWAWALLGATVLSGFAGCVHVAEQPLEPALTATAYTARSLQDPALAAYLTGQGVSLPAAGAPWDFETLCWVAFYERADLAVARAAWATAAAGPALAAERPNPTVTVNPGYNANPGDASPWFPAIDFDIPLLRNGARAAQVDQLRQLAEGRRQEVLAQAWTVRAELRAALAEATAADRRVAAWSDLQAIDQHLLSLWQQRQQLGVADATEVRSARLAAAQSAAALATAQQGLGQARVRVAAALGLPAAAVADLRLPDALAGAADEGPVPEPGPARAAALRARADVRAALADYAAAQAGLRAEVARQYPDIHLGPGYQWDQGASKWSLALSVEWPVFSRNAGAIATATTQRAEAAARFLAVQAAVVAAVDEAEAAVAGAAAQRQAVSAVLTVQQQQLAGREARLAVGATDQVAVQTARRELALSQLDRLEIELAAAQARGRLEQALQVPFAHMAALIATTETATDAP